MPPITTTIFKDINFSPEEKTLIESKLVKIDLKKGVILLHGQEMVFNQYYVLESCLRTYFID